MNKRLVLAAVVPVAALVMACGPTHTHTHTTVVKHTHVTKHTTVTHHVVVHKH